jgi:TRAP-type C4-dicarboxylate transport system permease small subunit
MNDEKKSRIKFALNNFEAYVALVLFFINLVLLFVQVVSRYVFNYSITWCEELATILYVGMIYCAISASVTQRKHLKIEAIYDLVPFKAKKVLMVISNVIFFFFCIYIQAPLYDMVKTLGFAKTSLLHIPKSYVYA